MSTMEMRNWTVTCLGGGEEKTENVEAAYYRMDDWAVEFKDTENRVVFMMPKERIASIRRAKP